MKSGDKITAPKGPVAWEFDDAAILLPHELWARLDAIEFKLDKLIKLQEQEP